MKPEWIMALNDRRPKDVTQWILNWHDWESNSRIRLIEQDIVDWVRYLELRVATLESELGKHESAEE